MLKQLRPCSYEDYLALPIIGPLLDDFCQWSRQRGYALLTIKKHLRGCRHITAFLCNHGVENLEHLGESDFDCAWQQFRCNYPGIAGAVRQLERFIREKHGLVPKPCIPLSRSSKELEHFANHLRKVMGYEENTIKFHIRYLKRFLNFIEYDVNENVLAQLQSNKIDDFLVFCSKTLGRYSLRHVVAYLRNFLRYQFRQGVLSIPLHETIHSPRTWDMESLPCSLPWDVVKQLLASINRRDTQGKRNYAMLLMAATYGLRSIEIVTLTLDDINWRGKRVLVRQQKTRNILALPLTNEIAEALIDYLRNVRPALPLREVFLRERAPIGRLKSSAVAEAFQREVRLAGLDIPYHGAHCLRHSFAVHHLRQGTSMKAIGDILGHQCPSSTNTYLRLSIDDLRSVALDVPNEPDNESTHPAVNLKTLPKKSVVREKIPAGPLCSFLADEISAYIRLHQGLGKDYRKEKRVLKSLDWFLINHAHADDLNGAVFEAWSQTLVGLCPSGRRTRMKIICNFCIYRRRLHPNTFVPDILTFPNAGMTRRSFILSPQDITRLLCAARQLPIVPHEQFRPEAIRMAILILYSCGLRLGELLRLKLADYNPVEETLFIRDAKFHKQRIIPLSVTVSKELHSYLDYCRQCGIDLVPEMPIISRCQNEHGGRAYTGSVLRKNWRHLCAELGILTPRGVPPRLHDARHSFAVNALLRCYHSGQDIQSRLPFLYTYMGHVNIASTYYYLSFIEPLRMAASDRFEQAFGNLAQPDSNLHSN